MAARSLPEGTPALRGRHHLTGVRATGTEKGRERFVEGARRLGPGGDSGPASSPLLYAGLSPVGVERRQPVAGLRSPQGRRSSTSAELLTDESFAEPLLEHRMAQAGRQGLESPGLRNVGETPQELPWSGGGDGSPRGSAHAHARALEASLDRRLGLRGGGADGHASTLRECRHDSPGDRGAEIAATLGHDHRRVDREAHSPQPELPVDSAPGIETGAVLLGCEDQRPRSPAAPAQKAREEGPRLDHTAQNQAKTRGTSLYRPRRLPVQGLEAGLDSIDDAHRGEGGRRVDLELRRFVPALDLSRVEIAPPLLSHVPNPKALHPQLVLQPTERGRRGDARGEGSGDTASGEIVVLEGPRPGEESLRPRSQSLSGTVEQLR